MNFNPNPYHQLYKRCFFASVLCYFISFIFPVYTTDIYWITPLQGFYMLFCGWLTAFINKIDGTSILFIEWLTNPIYYTLWACVLIRHLKTKGNYATTLWSRIPAYLMLFLGTLFFINGEVLDEDDKVMKQIVSFHIGYWLWLSSFVFTVIALMAKSKKGTFAHRSISFYINKTQRIPIWVKCPLAIALCYLIEYNAMLPTINPNGKKDELTGKNFDGYYQCCSKIGISFKPDSIALAQISSTEFVGRFCDEFHGTYTHDSSKIVIDWGENEVDMEYAVYDSIKHELTLYGGKEKYVLKEDL